MGTMLMAARKANRASRPSRVSAVAGDWLWYGPCLGEFGHELAAVPILRKRAKGFKRVTVCSRPGRGALYEGIADEFVGHDIVCQGNCESVASYERLAKGTIERWQKAQASTVWYQLSAGMNEQRYREASEFRLYGRREQTYAGAVVIHARNRPYAEQRNWPIRLWNKVARRLFDEGIPRIICVGTMEAAMLVEGACDLRDRGLCEQMNALRSARLAVGVSSGPMHLAEHCGCPIVVWCGGPEVEYKNTQRRYQTIWNPYCVPNDPFLRGGWRPSYNEVERHVLAMLERLDAMKWEHP